MRLNDYARGALEALAWILAMLDDGGDVGRIRRKVEGARDDLLRGISVDFRQRLRTY